MVIDSNCATVAQLPTAPKSVTVADLPVEDQSKFATVANLPTEAQPENKPGVPKWDTVSHLPADAAPEPAPKLNHSGRGVPYYDIDVMAHISSALEALEAAPAFYVDFRPFNDCTAYLPVYGESMTPLIQSGEIIAVRRVNNLDVLLWGEPYLVVTSPEANDLRTVKLIFQHGDPGCIILRASNPAFAGDTVVAKRTILGLYLVKGKISRRQL